MPLGISGPPPANQAHKAHSLLAFKLTGVCTSVAVESRPSQVARDQALFVPAALPAFIRLHLQDLCDPILVPRPKAIAMSSTEGRLSRDEFVTKLGELFEKSKEEHSVYITQKPYEEEGTTIASILLRVTDGRDDPAERVKFSTVIPAAEVDEFFSQHYLPQLRASLTAATLRKRDKAKERKVAKMLASLKERRDKNGGEEPVEGVGSKRGAGHRKRQQAQKRAERLRKHKATAAQKLQASGSTTASSSAPLSDPDVIMIDA